LDQALGNFSGALSTQVFRPFVAHIKIEMAGNGRRGFRPTPIRPVPNTRQRADPSASRGYFINGGGNGFERRRLYGAVK